MKLTFFIACIVTGIFGVGIWYVATAEKCPVPLAYRIGDFDEHFNITKEQAREYIFQAEEVWEREMGRELFVYDENAHFTVNFVFDERQASSDEEAQQRAALDAQAQENEEVFAMVEKLQKEYESIATAYEAKIKSYESRLDTYNKDVRRYNDQGGAPADVYKELEDTRTKLNQEASTLSQTAEQLNTLGSRINELNDRGNELVEVYNRQVDQYNKKFGHSREFTQGDYENGRINIYEFSNDGELLAVLAHEFGHALGIDHVEGTSSVMYYLLEEGQNSVALSVTDKSAFLTMCGAVDNSFEQRLRRIIRGALEKFTI